MCSLMNLLRRYWAGAALLLLWSCGAAATEVSLSVTGFTSGEGALLLRVYDSKSKWLSDKPEDIVLERAVPLDSSAIERGVTLVLELPEGEYAFTTFHDVDGDGKLKRNWMGMPREPVADSSNQKSSFGPPKYDKAAVDVAGAQLQIKISLFEY